MFNRIQYGTKIREREKKRATNLVETLQIYVLILHFFCFNFILTLLFFSSSYPFICL